MRRRLGVLGGTFDPIHRGHLDAAQAADQALGLTGLVFVPSNMPPHRPQPVASSYHRFAMAALAVAGHPRWRVADLELRAPEPSYTSATLARLRASGLGPTEIFFIVGADAFVEIPTWRDYPALLDQAHFAVVERPGWPVEQVRDRVPALASRMRTPSNETLCAAEPLIFLLTATTADVSSTTIRQRRMRGESCAGMVIPAVEQHIEQHGLYTDAAGAAPTEWASGHAPAGRLHGQD